jgi:hypothetical protein
MKKFAGIIILLIMFGKVSLSQGLGIGVGPSFWTNNDVSLEKFNLINKDLKAGINANFRIKFDRDFVTYTINAGWNKFSISDVTISDPQTKEVYDLSLSQNIFPLSPGIQLNLIRLSPIKIYIAGDVSLNIIKNSIDIKKKISSQNIPIPVIFGDDTEYRGGVAPGVGVEIDLGLLTLDVNAKLHYMNIINKKDNEPTTSFLMTNVSVFFGK